MEVTLTYQGKTIRKRKNGSGYYVRYRDANGQHTVYGQTPEQTKQKLIQALKTAPTKKRGEVLLKDWWFKWLDIYKQDIRPGTRRTYNTIFKTYLAKFAETPLSKLDIFKINDFLKSIKSSRQKVRTYNYLKSCLDKAFKLKLMESNPLELMPKPKHTKEHVKAFTKEEQQVFIGLLNEIDVKYADVFMVMLQQGLRIGEALGLTSESIDLVNRKITINKTYSNYTLNAPKTNTSIRTIPMFGNTYNILLKYIGAKPGERIFKYSATHLSELFKTITTKMGLTKVTPHSLRSTFATRLYEVGVPSLQIRDWLGHSDVSTTEKIYIKVMQESSLKWVNLANLTLLADTQKDSQMQIWT